MAVIGKIRQRAGLLIGIVGFSLVAFILGDLLTSNRSFLTGSGNDLAVIGGKKVNIQDFESMVQQLEENYKLNTGNQTIDQTTMESLREQAWTQLLNEEIMKKQYAKTGVQVSADELFEMIQGKNPHPQIKEAFKDPKTGEFSPANVLQFLKNMDNDATGKTRAQWIAFEKFIAEERMKEKYDQLIKHGLFVTTEEAKNTYEIQTKTASVKFIDFNYNTIVDSTIAVSDKELRDYYNSHQNDFKQEAARKLEYVTFDVVPSQTDREATLKSIDQLTQPFRESTDDSLFVSVNTDNKNEIAYFKRGTLSPIIDSTFFNGTSIGTVVGPYEENNNYKLSKLIDVKSISDSIKVSHALIAYAGSERAPAEVTRTKEQAQAMADSLMGLINKDPKKFTEIAKFQSDDKVSAEKEGDLDWITQESPMDPRFKTGAFETKKGSVSLVESNFGFHLIKVTDQTTPSTKVKVATIERRIEPGSKTYQMAFAKANEFASKNTNSEAFTKSVQEQGLNKRVAENLKETDKFIAGLESPRALIQWAYQSKEGDVSKTYDFGNKFVVAHLLEAKEKGIAPFEKATELVKGKVLTSKKAQLLIEKINAKSASAKTIEELATALGTQVKSAEGLNFASSFIPNLGVEPALVGTIFSIKQGQLSKPIEGTAGVFVAVVNSFTEPTAITDYTNNKNQTVQQLQQRASYEVFNALKEKAEIVDNRGKYY
ncbi:MAG: SurA N-terminal domain-containing protein [Bacteroidetes bacterium]|nr:SurA N-terminal domain-containing protein [Bacteroidota bacterium]